MNNSNNNKSTTSNNRVINFYIPDFKISKFLKEINKSFEGENLSVIKIEAASREIYSELKNNAIIGFSVEMDPNLKDRFEQLYEKMYKRKFSIFFDGELTQR